MNSSVDVDSRLCICNQATGGRLKKDPCVASELESDMVQLLGIADQINGDDTTMPVFKSYRIDCSIIFAQHETGQAVYDGGTCLRGG